ncbi:autophagy-related protein 22-like protein [Cladochytrium replicatum]|nr:autophagy-related protein 22-like protein [Cladochytrium replicatum]
MAKTTEAAKVAVDELTPTEASYRPTGERLEPTTKKERVSWFAYDWANHGISSAVTVFALPLFLDYLAFHAGSGYPAPVLGPGDSAGKLPDFAALTAANATWYQFGSCIAGNSSLPLTDQAYYDRCVVPWAGGYIRATTWTLNVTSISVACQAFFYITLGSLADHGGLRKRLLLIFTYIGVAASLLLLIPTPETYWLAAVFLVLMNIGYGTSLVLYVAYLPLLAEADPRTLSLSPEDKADVAKYQHKVEDVTNILSSTAFATAYLAGTFLAAVSGGMIILLGTPLGYKVSIVICGVWWGFFAIPLMLNVKERAGPPLPKGEFFATYSWKQLFKTLYNIPKLPRLFWFLLCWWIYSDSFGSLASLAVLFAQSELKLSSLIISTLVIIAPFGAAIGNTVTILIQRRVGASAKSTLMGLLAVYGIACCYGLVGLSPNVPIGFKNPKWWYEMPVFAFVHGFLLGPTQSYSRVVFSELIPPGRETEFFSIYAITDKGSSWIGPLIVGALNQAGGTLRLSFVYFVTAFLIPIPILFFLVDMVKGKKDALTMGRVRLPNGSPNSSQ